MWYIKKSIKVQARSANQWNYTNHSLEARHN